MNKTPVISVVIPVYNVEPWLSECVDSVLRQNIDDMEIVCVDDGSTDRTVEEAEGAGATVISHLVNEGKISST